MKTDATANEEGANISTCLLFCVLFCCFFQLKLGKKIYITRFYTKKIHILSYSLTNIHTPVHNFINLSRKKARDAWGQKEDLMQTTYSIDNLPKLFYFFFLKQLSWYWTRIAQNKLKTTKIFTLMSFLWTFSPYWNMFF